MRINAREKQGGMCADVTKRGNVQKLTRMRKGVPAYNTFLHLTYMHI